MPRNSTRRLIRSPAGWPSLVVPGRRMPSARIRATARLTAEGVRASRAAISETRSGLGVSPNSCTRVRSANTRSSRCVRCSMAKARPSGKTVRKDAPNDARRRSRRPLITKPGTPGTPKLRTAPLSIASATTSADAPGSIRQGPPGAWASFSLAIVVLPVLSLLTTLVPTMAASSRVADREQTPWRVGAFPFAPVRAPRASPDPPSCSCPKPPLTGPVAAGRRVPSRASAGCGRRGSPSGPACPRH